MKLLIGLVLGFSIGALCNLFVVPVPAPPVIEGALLVLAMTVGSQLVDKRMTKKSETSHQCGGPAGTTQSNEAQSKKENVNA